MNDQLISDTVFILVLLATIGAGLAAGLFYITGVWQ